MVNLRVAKLWWPCHTSAANIATWVQVVELPREGPEQALKLFGGLPNLRLLVIGGDGTVAWILSCIDSIQVSPSPHIIGQVGSISSCSKLAHRHVSSKVYTDIRNSTSQNLFFLTLWIKVP